MESSRSICAYGYGRVSTSKADQFYSPKAQAAIIKRHYDSIVSRLDEKPKWGGIFFDEASAKNALCDRPQGGALNAALKKGDHVIIAKTDRAFRLNIDQALTIRDWANRGIKLHFLDIPTADISTAEGELIVAIMSAVATFERRRCGQRTKDVIQWKLKHGLPAGKTPIGWIKRGTKRASRYLPNEEERAQASEIKRLWESFNRSRDKTVRHLRRNKQTFRGRTIYRPQLVKIIQAVQRMFALPNGKLIAGHPNTTDED